MLKDIRKNGSVKCGYYKKYLKRTVFTYKFRLKEYFNLKVEESTFFHVSVQRKNDLRDFIQTGFHQFARSKKAIMFSDLAFWKILETRVFKP